MNKTIFWKTLCIAFTLSWLEIVCGYGVESSLSVNKDVYEMSEDGEWPLPDEVLRVHSEEKFVINVDGSRTVANLSHFWESTGLCPPLPHNESLSYFLGQDMRHNLAYIGAIPNNGIKQVRIHWLLYLITVEKFQSGTPVYNFTSLDALIDLLWQNELNVGFEIMGNPSNYFTDFENKTQVYLWRDLVKQIAERYISRYGLSYVSQWKFETWNEPDHKDTDNLNITVQGFLNYYDACSEGLKAADPRLQFGGPAGACREPSYSKICWALFEHLTNGINFFTGQKGDGRVDYISYHKKGGNDVTGNSTYLLFEELNTTRSIWAQYPSLKNVPFVNDEADPVTGWNKPLPWRADAGYPAIVTKIIGQHQNIFHRYKFLPTYSLLSNDNGFLSWNPDFFTQRTLLARFQMNNTRPNHVQFIRKPVYDVMSLLSLLGDVQILTSITRHGKAVDYVNSAFGAIAALHRKEDISMNDSDELIVVVYNSVDTEPTERMDQYVIHLSLPESMKASKDLRFVKYIIDNNECSPYAMWQILNYPDTPTNIQLEMMRLAQCPKRVGDPTVLPTSSSLIFNDVISLPGVALFHICDKPASPPDQVTSLRLLNITHNQVLLVWSDSCVHARCLKTFEVEYSSSDGGRYSRINLQDDIVTLYVHAPSVTSSPPATVIGWYRVRAVDYWLRTGAYSIAVNYGP